MRIEMILVRIAAVLMFVSTAAVVAVGFGYFAHESAGVPPAIIRENALISAVSLSAILIVELFANKSDNQK